MDLKLYLNFRNHTQLPHMKKIFLPTDFSNDARHSMDYAAQLFTDEPVEFIIVHAITYTPLLVTTDEILEHIPTDNPPDLDLEQKYMEGKIKNPDTKVSTLEVKGTLPSVLKKEGARLGVDLIIMGPHGIGKNDEFGSNTLAVMKTSEIPVLIVTEDKQFHTFHKILFAADLRGYSKPLVFPMDYFVRKYNSEIDVVHFGREESGNKAEVMEQLIETFGEERSQAIYIDEENVVDGLNSTIVSHSPDLLVLVNRQRWFFSQLFLKSVTKRMVVDPPIPILVLFDKA